MKYSSDCSLINENIKKYQNIKSEKIISKCFISNINASVENQLFLSQQVSIKTCLVCSFDRSTKLALYLTQNSFFKMNKNPIHITIGPDISQANYQVLFKGIWTGVLICLVIHQFIRH